ncbi:gas vesicle protein GvpG [Nocardioides astragali]|uniref:Gas vesicle protein GvpG n=1 Tax=Nocardioides astragali TaxID=1776736 RepID=A0ABW2MYZ9_9ACTN|nr:gas vesicle protein GvpG [Nocardioides astragali]
MGLITGLLTLPLAPLRGTVAVAEQVLHAAEEEFYDPERIRGLLEDVERRRDAGELSEEEAIELEDELIERMVIGANRRRREG